MLILGLIGLTFYAYYRTTYYDVPQYAVSRNISKYFSLRLLIFFPVSEILYPRIGRDAYQEAFKQHINLTIDQHVVTAPKNASSEPFIFAPYNLQIIANLSSSTATTSSTSSTSLIQSSVNVSNETKEAPASPNEYLARTIYEAGHTVPIPERCPNFGKEMDLVIIIMSAPTHLEARTAIRQTWGHFGQRSDISILFMLGATLDSRIEVILKKEQKTYNDVIRGKFLDSYSNLTLKTISTLEWVDSYCSKVKFLLKTDDDMFINVPRLQSFAMKHAKDRNVIFGRLAKKWKPIRNKKSKYYVSRTQFKNAVFPDFTTGPAYLLSTDIVRKLYEAALDQTYLKLEDVFVTGIVADKLKIKRTHANEFLNKKISYSAYNVQRSISIHMVKYSEQFDLWKKLLDGKSKCK